MKKLLFILLLIAAAWGLDAQQWEFYYSNGAIGFIYGNGFLYTP